MKFLLRFSLFFCFLFSGLNAQEAFKHLAYYSGDSATLHEFDFNGITHLVYGFGHVTDGVFGVNHKKDRATLEAIKKIKKENPNLKTLIALGGWGGCEFCSQTFNNETQTKSFVQSIKYFLEYYDLDGIDLDWEYPAIAGVKGHQFIPEDKENFTHLVKMLRQKLGDDKIITFAAGGFQKYLDQSIEWKEVEPYINFVNLMSYDLVNGFSTRTGHHTPLYSSYKGERSVDSAINFFKSIHFPLKKVVIGAAFYSRSFENVPNKNHGIYQPAKFKAYVPYTEAKDMFTKENGYTFYWDKTNAAGFWYNPKTKIFVTGDTPKSIQMKVQYVKDQHLGGLMYWELGTDDPKDGLYKNVKF